MSAQDIADVTIKAVASGPLTYVCALPSEGPAVGFGYRLYAEYTMGKILQHSYQAAWALA